MMAAPGMAQPITDDDVQGSSVIDVDVGQSAGGKRPSINAKAVTSSNTMPKPMKRFSADFDGVFTPLAYCNFV